VPVEIDWGRVERELDGRGFASVGSLLNLEDSRELRSAFDDEGRFRKHVVMEAHSYGRGDYKYFDYPLPQTVQSLRTGFYPRLAPIAQRWAEALGRDISYPDTLDDYLEECHRAAQTRATPLILRYTEGGYNRLHQDLYGDLYFPIQLVILLSDPTRDFTGGDIVLTEQRARVQARPHVIRLQQGEGLLFAVNERPTQGARGTVKTMMRHGVGEVTSGERYTLGVIFHDAK
jgi:hypothetical protein